MDAIQVNITGKLGADPERRVSAAGRQWLRLPVRVGDGDGALWLNVAVFDPAMIDAADAIERGQRVRISGRLSAKGYLGKDGAPRASLNVIAETIETAGGAVYTRSKRAKAPEPDIGQGDMLADEDRRQGRGKAQSEATKAWEGEHQDGPIPF